MGINMKQDTEYHCGIICKIKGENYAEPNLYNNLAYDS